MPDAKVGCAKCGYGMLEIIFLIEANSRSFFSWTFDISMS